MVLKKYIYFIKHSKKTLKKKIFYYIEFCDAITSIDPKKQLEFSGLCPDAIGIVLDLVIL